jgi:hypothetical protein
MSTALQELIRDKILSFKGKVFSVEFKKKDGTLRRMTARHGVRKGVKGTGKPLDIKKHPNLITVTDMVVAAQKGAENAFRMISLDQITYLKCQSIEFGERVE